MDALTAVIVVAAGSGTRLGAAEPKAFVDLAGRTLLEHALDAVRALPEPTQIIVVAPASHLELAQRLLGADGQVVAGGATRSESVAAGLAAVVPSVATVLVHDAARALTPTSLFGSVIDTVRITGSGVVPALPVVDTLKRVDLHGTVLDTADRSELAAAQTPQGFPAAQLAQAYAQALSSGSTADTDDASTFAAAGFEVITIPGDPRAFKITTAEDLARATTELLGLTSDLRVGQGTDVHAFGEAENLWLAGLHWPGEKELSGHSDGDAVAHAITDALLAAAGLGDIGSNFGVDDPTYANARGEIFVRGAVKLVNEAGFDILNVSVQIIGNRPKFSPRRDEANRVVGEWLGAPVNVSATTTDGLGFTGRGEGIAAQATALLRARG
jgi:2-C-methyl-D-erythritol 4-phosphate cytidylyltransferase/2-C-methyl-D-erythritol 2,4-cyclodiphosphate synthase